MPTRRSQLPCRGGIFTRSRSELLLHRTRSGRARPGPPGAATADAKVKNLRAKRVFSSYSASAEGSPDRAVNIGSRDDDSIQTPAAAMGSTDAVDEMVRSGKEKVDGVETMKGSEDDSFQSTPPESVVAEEAKLSLNDARDQMKLDSISPAKSKPFQRLVPCSRSKLVRDPSSFSYRRLLPFLMEIAKDGAKENSPCKNKATKNEKMIEEKSSPPCRDLPSDQQFQLSCPEDTQQPPSPPSNQHPPSSSEDSEDMLLCKTFDFVDIKACEALELNPLETNGVGPIHLAITEDSENMSLCKNSDFFEIKASESLALVSPQSNGITPIHPNSFEDSKNMLLCKTFDFVDAKDCESLAFEPVRTNEVSPIPLSSSENLENILLCKASYFMDTKVCESLELELLEPKEVIPIEMTPSPNSNGRVLQVSVVKSEYSLGDPIMDMNLLYRPACTPTGITLSMEEMAGSQLSLAYPSKDTEVGIRNVIPASDFIRKPLIGRSQSGVIQSSERHVLSPKKGILKRHTRGCKGICMCLDCVSFRVHADRAYEFSRKQMQEADGIIGGLIKELTSLRSQAEKSVVPMPGNEIYPFHVNQEIMKGACQRAVRAEAVANKLRRQLFIDLNLHCRIPGPRVTFAEYIEEKIFPSSDSHTRDKEEI